MLENNSRLLTISALNDLLFPSSSHSSQAGCLTVPKCFLTSGPLHVFLSLAEMPFLWFFWLLHILQDSAQCQLLQLLLPHPSRRPPTILTLCFSFMACNCLFICLYTFSLFCCPTMMWALCKQTLVGRAAKHLGWRAHRRADWERWHLGCPQVGKQMCLWSYRGQGVTRNVNLIQGEAFRSPSDQTMEKTMRWEHPTTGVTQAEIGQPWSGPPDVLGPCRMDSLPYMG